MSLANKLKKSNPDMDFKTANSILAKTVGSAASRPASASSRRPSKRAKRSHDESFDEEEDSQSETPADQVNDQPQDDDFTLDSIVVNNETQANETQANDFAQADDSTQADDHAQVLDHQNDGQDQQPAGDVQIDAQAQSPVDQANDHAVYQDNHQGEPSMVQADYPAHADQPVMMQQGESFNHQFPQAP